MTGTRAVGKRIALLALFASTGCSLSLADSENGTIATNTCGSDSDCPGGSCWSGMCVSNQGSLSGVFIQVTPPTSVASVGGTRLTPCDSVGESACVPKNVFSLTQSSSDFKLHLPAAIPVDGYVLLDDMAGCESLRVTLIPLEQGFGLPAVSYVAQAAAASGGGGICPAQSSGARGASFSVNAAPGRYDIYLEPASAQSTAGDGGTTCNFVPRLFREVPIATKTCLSSSPLQTLNLKIQWPPGSAGIDSLANWTADIIHPTTGQLLSERKTVPADGNVAIAYSEVLVRESGTNGMSTVVHEDPGQDLVRLTPPVGITAPVIQLVRSGLEALSSPNNGVTPPLGPFPAPVPVQGWVYDADKYNQGQNVAVPSTLTMTATNIPGVTPGIFASFTVDPDVDARTGSFEAQVLPGEYRVRVVPRAGQGLAVLETSLSVRCVPDPKDRAKCASLGSPGSGADGGPPPNAGKTLLVPRAATVRGGVAAGFGGGKIDDATIQALPAAFGKRACVLADGGLDAGGPDAGCAVSKVGVLDIALGEGGFVPRAASTTAIGSSFTMSEVDCGGCGHGAPAYFDISVRTLDGSRFPWFVRTGVAVESDLDLGRLSLPLPIVQQGVVDIPNGPAEKPTPVAGALVTAYVLRNDLGAYVQDPTGLKSCTSVGSGPREPGVRCIRSVLQVGETRSGNDGSFELVLPSSIE